MSLTNETTWNKKFCSFCGVQAETIKGQYVTDQDGHIVGFICFDCLTERLSGRQARVRNE